MEFNFYLAPTSPPRSSRCPIPKSCSELVGVTWAPILLKIRVERAVAAVKTTTAFFVDQCSPGLDVIPAPDGGAG